MTYFELRHLTYCDNKPPERKWSWSVDDVMPGRDGPENLRILKKSQLEVENLYYVCLSRKISSQKEEKQRKTKRKIENIKIMIYVENIN